MSVILQRLGSALILVGSLGCESTGVPTEMYHDYQEYLSKSHYRAFAATPRPTQGSAVAAGWSWGYGTVESAINGALENCQKRQEKYTKIFECRLHSVGDINVDGMSEEQLDKAIALYKSNIGATNVTSGTAAASPATTAGGAQLTNVTGTISTREEFENLVVGRPLTNADGTVRIVLNADGTMSGTRADGARLSGPWYFDDGYFCREPTYRGKSLGWDCQVVTIDGNDVTFHRDRGTGKRVKYRFL